MPVGFKKTLLSSPVAIRFSDPVLPATVSTLIFADTSTLPVTTSDDRLPTLVIFGCAAVDNVPLILLPEIFALASRTTTVFAVAATSEL